MEEQQAKIIIAHFIKKGVDDINKTTVMNYTVVSSSLMLHRMYAALADKGYVVNDPSSIVNYGDFLRSIKSFDNVDRTRIDEQIATSNLVENQNALAVGIDIENISLFEEIDDYTNNQFYKQNFSPEEIQYCIGKASPVESFAGLFSIKEAIVKADNSFKKIKFNKINITHTINDKPLFDGFSLSISHQNKYVIAIACKIDNQKNESLSKKEIKQLVAREVKKTVHTLIIIGGAILLFCAVIIYNFAL